MLHSSDDSFEQAMATSKAFNTLTVDTVNAPNVGTIKIIQLQREKAKNAISRRLLQELSVQIEEIHSEKVIQTRVLVISSALEDVFCAGADLIERKDMTQEETQDFLASLRSTFLRLSTLPIPTIACVSGLALGGGLELALCCQLRVFSDNAVVGLPETRLAVIPGAGGTYRLSQLIGLSNARDLVLTGRRVKAREAAGMGLCNRIVASDGDAALDLKAKLSLTLGAGINLAQEIARGGPVSIRAAVSALTGGNEAEENTAYEAVLQTKDRIEALQAFREKRLPVFIGE